MKILSLQGSPRKKGNTSRMLAWVEEALAAAGHEVERKEIAEHDIKGCISCYRCQQNVDELVCSVKDAGNEILMEIAASDAIIYASPLYCWGFSGQLKPLLDRHLCFMKNMMDPAESKSYLEGKRMGLLVTCGGPDEEGNTDIIKKMWERMTDFLKVGTSHKLVVPNCTEPDNLGDEQQAAAKEFAQKVLR